MLEKIIIGNDHSRNWPYSEALKVECAALLSHRTSQTVPIPPELLKLDALSNLLIQRAKCYQTGYGTYTAKVPVYNSLKACKGTCSFFNCL